MVRKLVGLVLVTCGLGWGAENWNGWLDTTGILEVEDSGVVVYSRGSFDLSNYENSAAVLCWDDTTSTGFASDSAHFRWGFQEGYLVLNTSAVRDTVWGDRVVIDTVSDDSCGKTHLATQDVNGTFTYTGGTVDTSGVTGWACQPRAYTPRWGCVVRYWAEGLSAKNKQGEEVKVRVSHMRRIFQRTRD